MTTHSSILAWRIPWTEEPGGLQSMGLHGAGHDCNDLAAANRRNLLITAGTGLFSIIASKTDHILKLLLLLSRFSHVQPFQILWTVVYQAPLSMELSRQECWSGLSFLPPGYSKERWPRRLFIC